MIPEEEIPPLIYGGVDVLELARNCENCLIETKVREGVLAIKHKYCPQHSFVLHALMPEGIAN